MIRAPFLLLCAALFLAAPLLTTGCAGTPRKGTEDPASQSKSELGEEELRDLLALSRLVVVARLEERSEKEGVVRHRLLVREALKGDTKGEVTASDFLYVPNHSKGGTIEGLVELGHYLFFLAPGAGEDSPWIHLRDPSQDPMPASQPLVEQIRFLVAEQEAIKSSKDAAEGEGQ